jgi:hypothetical protein
VTRVGKLELRVPQDRQGHFSTQLFERYQRSEKALVGALAEMYVPGVSTRKVKAITQELCGHEFSASAMRSINKTLDESLEKFATRPLEEPYPYLILDAWHEKVREDGVIRSQAVQIAIGIHEEGRRQILARDAVIAAEAGSAGGGIGGLRRSLRPPMSPPGAWPRLRLRLSGGQESQRGARQNFWTASRAMVRAASPA